MIEVNREEFLQFPLSKSLEEFDDLERVFVVRAEPGKLTLLGDMEYIEDITRINSMSFELICNDNFFNECVSVRGRYAGGIYSEDFTNVSDDDVLKEFLGEDDDHIHYVLCHETDMCKFMNKYCDITAKPTIIYLIITEYDSLDFVEWYLHKFQK